MTGVKKWKIKVDSDDCSHAFYHSGLGGYACNLVKENGKSVKCAKDICPKKVE